MQDTHAESTHIYLLPIKLIWFKKLLQEPQTKYMRGEYMDKQKRNSLIMHCKQLPQTHRYKGRGKVVTQLLNYVYFEGSERLIAISWIKKKVRIWTEKGEQINMIWTAVPVTELYISFREEKVKED